MDVGPLGYLSIAAHGHADALAVTLSAQGRELIVDPGTASFYGKPEWRAVHRGTRAHPTVCVDGVDQSAIGGTFYWRQHAVTTVRSVDLDGGVVDAEHDGYTRLEDPVVHRRWLIAPPGDTTVAVVDLLDGRSVHDVAVSWPLHPELEVTPDSNGHMVIRDGRPGPAAVLRRNLARRGRAGASGRQFSAGLVVGSVGSQDAGVAGRGAVPDHTPGGNSVRALHL